MARRVVLYVYSEYMIKDSDRVLLERCIDDARSHIENYPRIVDT